jgi:hypothetical protein
MSDVRAVGKAKSEITVKQEMKHSNRSKRLGEEPKMVTLGLP